LYELSGTLAENRLLGSSVVIKDKNGGRDKLWIIGPSQSGDFIYSDGTIEPGDYPYNHEVNGACMVQVETGEVFIMGGAYHNPDSHPQYRKVTRYTPADGTFSSQQPMKQLRQSFACATFKSAKHGGREVVYAAGGQFSSWTAEILDYSQTEVWEQLDYLPWGTAHGPIAVTNKDGTGVFHYYSGSIAELTCDSSCSFSELVQLTNQEISSRSAWPNIIPIPDSLATCS